MAKNIVHHYIPNSVPDIKKAMLKEIGVEDIEELYRDIPEKLRLKRKLNLPPPKSEYEVRRTITTIMAKNKTPSEILCFLGGGCWPHYVPAVCDEINGRSEFVTTYGSPLQLSPGMHQVMFEYQSMMGELLAMDSVVSSLFDWATVCGEAVRMASRITGRSEILVPKIISPDRLSVIKNYSERVVKTKVVNYDLHTGLLDLEDLKSKISFNTAGVYIENPSYLGFIEPKCEEIAEIAHDKGALSIVGVDPSSLGVLTPPGEYGADIVVGEGQPLGIHMAYGGGLLGIMAFRDKPKFIQNSPTRRMLSITTTDQAGVWGFIPFQFEGDMFIVREKGTSFVGTTNALWSITAAVYLALMGPQGMRKLGETIMQKSHYALKLLSEIKRVKSPIFSATPFKEFTVNFDRTGKTVQNVNKTLLRHGIQGGKDLTNEFPELGNSALYCVTEIHTKDDIDKLANALKESVRGG